MLCLNVIHVLLVAASLLACVICILSVCVPHFKGRMKAIGGFTATLLLFLAGIYCNCVYVFILFFISLPNFSFFILFYYSFPFPFIQGHAYCQTLSFRPVDYIADNFTLTFITTVSATYSGFTGDLCANGINNSLASSMCQELSLQYMYSQGLGYYLQNSGFNGEQHYSAMYCILDCF